MRRTKKLKLFPLSKGLDLSSIPGGQDPRSLTRAKNIVIRNRGTLRKAPGIRSLEYAGPRDGLQAAIQFFGTSGGAQFSEVLQVRKGRVEVIRNGQAVDLGLEVSPTDTVTFTRFSNRLIIHFENTSPKLYQAGGTSLSDVGILSGHMDVPPTFSVKHHSALWYAGRGNFPHRLTKSAVDNIANYSLTSGGSQYRIDEGDGDPVGLTGLSQTFRGDLFAFKWNSIHRLYLSNYGYGREQFAEGVGCVHHNTIVTLKNEIYFVSNEGIHSLSATDKYGAAEEATISYPIYEWFQENVNWAAYKYMVAVYDKQSNSYMLSFPTLGSSVPNIIIAFNLLTNEFYTWEDLEYPVLATYFDVGRQRALIGANEKGLGFVDETISTRFGNEFDVEIKTGPIFPVDEKEAQLNFTKAWLYVKPMTNSFDLLVRWYVDDELAGTATLDPAGGGTGAQIGVTRIGATNVTIQGNKKRFHRLPFELNASGSAIEFEFIASPSGENDTKIEIYGLVFEYEYNEDDENNKAV